MLFRSRSFSWPATCWHHILHPPQQGLKLTHGTAKCIISTHHILHPPQQGLKRSFFALLKSFSFHHILHPPQQGLKQSLPNGIAFLDSLRGNLFMTLSVFAIFTRKTRSHLVPIRLVGIKCVELFQREKLGSFTGVSLFYSI